MFTDFRSSGRLQKRERQRQRQTETDRNGRDRLEFATDSKRATGPSLVFKPSSVTLGWMSSWYSGAGYGRSGSSDGWNGRRRGSWSEKSAIRFEDDWYYPSCSTENWRSCTELLQTSVHEKIAVLETMARRTS